MRRSTAAASGRHASAKGQRTASLRSRWQPDRRRRSAGRHIALRTPWSSPWGLAWADIEAPLGRDGNLHSQLRAAVARPPPLRFTDAEPIDAFEFDQSPESDAR